MQVKAEDIIDIFPLVIRFIRTQISEFKPAQLSFAHFRVVGMIQHQSPTNKQLAEWNSVSVAAMSRMLDGLVKRGLVTRTAAEKDRRQVDLRVTPKGLEIHHKMNSALKDRLRKKFEGMGAKEKQSLVDGLTILRGLFQWIDFSF